ncbi:MAG: trehalose-6-phosphate synthase [Chloroflexota bacterium]|nr:trehalose-6-phosphate synthase [Chloroflexota bacterium]
MAIPASADRHIVIVANRGPNDFVLEDGAWVARPASGGLVSMLAPLARQPHVSWVCCVSEPPGASRTRRALYTTAADQTDPELDIVPVPLPAEVYHAYYGQISNEVLWMLQHGLIGPFGTEYLDERRHRAWEQGYLAANGRLAAAIVARAPAPAAFLIQDYHLYPLPALLRQHFPAIPILHFTHIPFPEPSVLKLLPKAWRETILRGLLGADVVGFQTGRDVRAFLACCEELLEREIDRRASTVSTAGGRRVRARAFPASVDPPALRETMGSEPVAAARRRLAPDVGGQSVVRVDRLDPSKNQVIGFLAFGRLLELRPDLRGRVRFLAFLVPSRTDLRVYRAYRDAVYRMIERINGRFAAECGGEPIQVFYTNDREQALAAMADCDVLLVNSLADGMNLVAKEWAVVSERPGALIASETAGVAEETADSALLVSPLDVEGTARAMAQALDMRPDERAARLARLQGRVARWTAAEWLTSQLAELGCSDGGPANAKRMAATNTT